MTLGCIEEELEQMKSVVSSPSRLHLGDIDPFGIGRFGYAPLLAVDKPRTIVEASASDSLKVTGQDSGEARVYAKRVLEAYGLPGVRVRVLSTAPRHSGFGSTTQLSLSVGKAVTLAYGIDADSVDLVEALKRTSTGGLHAFQHGGFVIAGGLNIKLGEPILNREDALIPPLILRAHFPEEWRFLTVRPLEAPASPSGGVEERSFRRLQAGEPPRRLIHEAYFILMSRLVPSILEKDHEAFGEALDRIQLLVGRIYQPVQGSVFNPASAWLIPILRREGALGVGQSSWGPTVYAFLEDEERAAEMEDAFRENYIDQVVASIAQADNSGAEYTVLKS